MNFLIKSTPILNPYYNLFWRNRKTIQHAHKKASRMRDAFRKLTINVLLFCRYIQHLDENQL